MEFRSAYGLRKDDVVIDFTGTETVTEQNHKKETDINYILAKYDKTGLITHTNNARAEYGDFTAVNEYQESLTRVIKAEQAFGELPSSVRKRFGNDPGEFFEFATNPDNIEALADMGLANRPEVVTPLETPVETPPTGA